MNKEYFLLEMKRLTTVLQVKEPENFNITLKEYEKRFVYLDAEQFTKMIDLLIDDGKTYKLPSISEFKAVKATVYRQDTIETTKGMSEYDKGSQGCLTALMDCVQKIVEMHKAGLIFNGEKLGEIKKGCAPLNFDEWARLGRPKTWSSVYDYMNDGAYKTYCYDMKNGTNKLKDFYVDFYNSFN